MLHYSVQTHRGEQYFQNNKLLYVNRATEDFTVPYHNHDFLEFAYISEGVGFHHLGEEVKEAQRGHLFLIPIGVPHVFRPASNNKNRQPLIVYNCVFSTLLLQKLIAFTSDPAIILLIKEIENGKLNSDPFYDKNDRFEKIFLEMHRQYSLSLAGSEDYLHTLLLQLIIELSCSIEPIKAGEFAKDAAFNELLHYLENHYHYELTLADLAQISRYSERHLQRLFQRNTGQSWHRYLQNIRISKSRELLRAVPHKISTIAEMVGYKDLHTFNRIFKRCTGMTPSMYRKEANNSR